MKNKGFTLIEVVIAILVLAIIIIPIFNINFMAYKNTYNTLNKDKEYNITRSICEKFNGETGIIQNKTVVIYLNDINEITQAMSVTNTIANEISFSNIDYDNIKNNNFNNKRYAIIMNGLQTEYLSVLRVTTLSMGKSDNGVSLRIARSS